MINRLVNC